MPENDLRLLVQAAKEAGQIALPFWKNAPKTWEKSGDAGPVTEADLAVNDLLKSKLLSARPEYGWLSEESDDTIERLQKRRVFIVDPIDGTRAFIAGEKTWSHSLAIAVAGKVSAAVVYLPAYDKMYTASANGGAFLNDQPIRNSDRQDIRDARVLTTRANLQAHHWPNGLPPLKSHFRSSLAYRLALVAEGQFDAMLTFRETWEWDVAAGALIASEAGAAVTDQGGLEPVFNNAIPRLNGMVAAAPALKRQLTPHQQTT